MKNPITLYQLLLEMKSWGDCSNEQLEAAKASLIDEHNHLQFALYVKHWQNGHYNEDPDTLIRDLLNLIP